MHRPVMPLISTDAAQARRVEPAAAARAAGDRAEFVAAHAQMLADFVVELGRERTAADARRVRLHDAEHVVEAARPDAGARASLPRHAVGRRDERIRAVIDVEQRALRAFEQHALAARGSARPASA